MSIAEPVDRLTITFLVDNGIEWYACHHDWIYAL